MRKTCAKTLFFQEEKKGERERALSSTELTSPSRSRSPWAPLAAAEEEAEGDAEAAEAAMKVLLKLRAEPERMVGSRGEEGEAEEEEEVETTVA